MHHTITNRLRVFASQLSEGHCEQLDFRQLAESLSEAGKLIDDLLPKAASAEALIKLFREDLLARARAVAKLTGNNSRLIERLINSEQTTLEELLVLKRDLEAAFDAAFTSTLKATSPGVSEGEDKLAQFKIG